MCLQWTHLMLMLFIVLRDNTSTNLFPFADIICCQKGPRDSHGQHVESAMHPCGEEGQRTLKLHKREWSHQGERNVFPPPLFSAAEIVSGVLYPVLWLHYRKANCILEQFQQRITKTVRELSTSRARNSWANCMSCLQKGRIRGRSCCRRILLRGKNDRMGGNGQKLQHVKF